MPTAIRRASLEKVDVQADPAFNHLTSQGKLAPSSIVVTTAALRFLYNVTLKIG